MLRFVFAFVLFLALPLSAQTPIAATPATLGDTAGAWIYRDDSTADFVAFDGRVLMTKTVSEKDQEFVTRWKDANGFDQEVHTKFSGRSDGARKAAAQRHAAAVANLVAEVGGPAGK